MLKNTGSELACIGTDLRMQLAVGVDVNGFAWCDIALDREALRV